MLKIGIDNYCYHRLFELEGEGFDTQATQPKGRWTVFDFIKRAKELKVDGVSLETCFLESLEPDYLKTVRKALDEANLDRVLAWGHPDGLEGGRNLAARISVVKAICYRTNSR